MTPAKDGQTVLPQPGKSTLNHPFKRPENADSRIVPLFWRLKRTGFELRYWPDRLVTFYKVRLSNVLNMQKFNRYYAIFLLY